MGWGGKHEERWFKRIIANSRKKSVRKVPEKKPGALTRVQSKAGK